MKMKTLTAIAITLIGALHAVAAPPTLLDRAKARDAKVAAAQAALAGSPSCRYRATDPPGTVDPKLAYAVREAQAHAVDYVAKLIGPDWREAWEASTLPDPDDILADRYMQTPFDLRPVWKFDASALIQSITPLKRAELLDHKSRGQAYAFTRGHRGDPLCRNPPSGHRRPHG